MFNISFLNAGILIASISAILPLLIHLFSKQKPKKLYFSSLKFIKESLKERNKSIKIKNILIIIIRTLIVLLTILGISRPALKMPFLKSKQTRNETAIAVILDNSYSMEYLAENETELEKAKQKIIELNKLLNDKDMTLLLTRDKQWNRLNANLGFGRFNESILNNISYSLNPEGLKDLIEEASLKLQESNYLHKEIYIITDFQNEELPNKSEIPIFIIPSSENQSRSNLACTNAQVESDYLNNPYQKNIKFDIRNYSDLAQSDIVIKLNLNGSDTAEKMISLSAKQSKSDIFTISNTKVGWNQGFVEVKNERLETDNRFYFSFYIEEQLKVGIFSDNNLDKSFNTMLDIFLQSNGTKEYLNSETFSNDKIRDYSFFIIKKNTFKPQLKLLLMKMKENQKNALFILEPGLNVDDKNWIESLFNVKIEENKTPTQGSIDFNNKYHKLSNIFEGKQLRKQSVSSFYNLKIASLTNVLLQANSNVIALENYFCLWNIDFNDTKSSFIYNTEFPIFMFRTFQYLTNQEFSNKSYHCGDQLYLVDGTIRYNQTKTIPVKDSKYPLLLPGIYEIHNHNEKDKVIAVNLKDYHDSDYQRLKQKSNHTLKVLSKDWKAKILQSRLGIEIWKFLFIIVILLILTEMFLIKKHENRNK